MRRDKTDKGIDKIKYKKSDLEGLWHIIQMSTWDKEYCNMEVQAYIKIEKGGAGEFQFGLVQGQICGEFKKEEQMLDFTWDGSDECDDANGDGWVKIKEKDILEGEIRFHGGDKSDLLAKKVKGGSR